MKKFCKTCRLADLKQNICKLYGLKIDPQKDFCSKHKAEIGKCEICEGLTLKTFLVPDGTEWHELCVNCVNKINTCNFCRSGSVCAFETDPDPLPKQITQTQRSPMGVIQTQVRNPEREQKFCSTCRCWSVDLSKCNKSNDSSCSRMDFIYETPAWLEDEE